MTFAEVLDETLSAHQPEPAGSYHPRGFRTAALHPFLFDRIDAPVPPQRSWRRDCDLTTPRIGAVRPAGLSARTPEHHRAVSPAATPAAADAAPTTPAGTPARPARRLTIVQRRSLDTLIGFGAGIHSDFSAGQLRSAFRTLALQYHPDRHPFAGDREKAALARHFSAITTSYETLLTVLEGPTG